MKTVEELRVESSRLDQVIIDCLINDDLEGRESAMAKKNEIDREIELIQLDALIDRYNAKHATNENFLKAFVRMSSYKDITLDWFTANMGVKKQNKCKELADFVSKYDHLYFKVDRDNRPLAVYCSETIYLYQNGEPFQSWLIGCERNRILVKPLTLSGVERDLNRIVAAQNKVKAAMKEYEEQLNKHNRWMYNDMGILRQHNTHFYLYEPKYFNK